MLKGGRSLSLGFLCFLFFGLARSTIERELFNLNARVLLAMAALYLIAFAPLLLEYQNFVALYVLYDAGLDEGSLDGGRPELHVALAVGDEEDAVKGQRVIGCCVRAVGDVERIVLANLKLLVSNVDDGVHKVSSALGRRVGYRRESLGEVPLNLYRRHLYVCMYFVSNLSDLKSMKITLPGTQTSIRPGKLLCIGRNYAKHAEEMKSDVPDEPMVFLKPATALVGDGGTVVLPPQSQDVHHEVELVAVIGKEGRHIDPAEALGYVSGYALGIDVTARDVQSAAKERRHPWSVAKGFDTFAPLGAITPAAEVSDPQNMEIRLTVNGEDRQRGHTRDMIFSVADLVAYCSQIFTLEPGDLIYTGTPEGVGPIADGHRLEATADGLSPLRLSVRRAEHRRLQN